MEHLTFHTILLGGLSGINFCLILYILRQLSDVKKVVYETRGYLKGLHDRGVGSVRKG